MRWLLLALLMCSACRTHRVGPYELAETRVHEGVTKAGTTADRQGPADLRVRFNPAPCECPPFEVFAYGRWMRAFVDAQSPALEGLRAGEPLAVATLLLQLQPKRRAAENGVLYPVASPP